MQEGPVLIYLLKFYVKEEQIFFLTAYIHEDFKRVNEKILSSKAHLLPLGDIMKLYVFLFTFVFIELKLELKRFTIFRTPNTSSYISLIFGENGILVLTPIFLMLKTLYVLFYYVEKLTLFSFLSSPIKHTFLCYHRLIQIIIFK